MKLVNRRQVIQILKSLGVRPGDGLLVHSALQFLGRPEGGVGMYFEALKDAVSAGGTLAVPAFNFAFARGEPYDPQTTPAEGMGIFSEYIRRQPHMTRTPHPMQSLAVWGQHAADLAGRDTLAAFDPGSAFERLLELDFKVVLLGADAQAVSLFHYSEQRLGVPYRYWKNFTGDYLTADGWVQRTYRMYVRDLDVDVHLEAYPVQHVLKAQDQWQTEKLNYGHVTVFKALDFTAALDHIVATDPWSLAANRDEAYQRYLNKYPAEAGDQL